MNVETHWEKIYREKAPDAVSWYRPHLETSLALIERAAPERGVSIIDVGGGESTLVDDLLAHGYENITVLDISPTAIDANRQRLGGRLRNVCIGLSRTSVGSNCSPPFTMCGTTALSFIFLPRQATVSLTSA